MWEALFIVAALGLLEAALWWLDHKHMGKLLEDIRDELAEMNERADAGTESKVQLISERSREVSSVRPLSEGPREVSSVRPLSEGPGADQGVQSLPAGQATLPEVLRDLQV